MIWNYRVFKQNHEFVEWYDIREVYYDDNGKPSSYTAELMHPTGETIAEIREELERMLKACKRPYLTKTDFEPSSSDDGAL